LTYTTHNCWPAMHETLDNENYSFKACGGSSVDRSHLSIGRVNTKKDTKKKKLQKREYEYATSGWSLWVNEKDKRSMFDFHYNMAIRKDPRNLMRGSALSSMSYIKRLMEKNPTRFTNMYRSFEKINSHYSDVLQYQFQFNLGNKIKQAKINSE